MGDLGNKEIMASNILRLMADADKSRNQVCQDLGFNYQTFSDWVNAKKYPRIDKIEIMANYFGVNKSDLIEEFKNAPTPDAGDGREEEFIELYSQLSDNEKKLIVSQMKGILADRE